VATFATNSDVEQRFSGGTDTLAALTQTTPYDATQITRARQRAHGWLVGKISVRYSLPADLSGHTDLVNFLRESELDLIEEEAWSWAKKEIPEAVKNKAAQTRKFFEDVAARKAELPASSALATTSLVTNDAETTGPDRVFTREDMGGIF